LKLIRGSIDQVDQKAVITWVQPRVLSRGQIGKLASLCIINHNPIIHLLSQFPRFLSRSAFLSHPNYHTGIPTHSLFVSRRTGRPHIPEQPTTEPLHLTHCDLSVRFWYSTASQPDRQSDEQRHAMYSYNSIRKNAAGGPASGDVHPYSL